MYPDNAQKCPTLIRIDNQRLLPTNYLRFTIPSRLFLLRTYARIAYHILEKQITFFFFLLFADRVPIVVRNTRVLYTVRSSP